MENIFNSQSIPAWFVAATLVLTGFMWILTIKSKVRIPVDFTGVALTFILEGLVFGIVYQFFGLDIEFRGFTSRMMIIILAMSQFIPLAIAYNRSLKR